MGFKPQAKHADATEAIVLFLELLRVIDLFLFLLFGVVAAA